MKLIGVELESVTINGREGDNLSPEYKRKAVNGKIPLLEVEPGIYISESVAICRYLDEVNSNDVNLFGSNPLEKAQIEMWNRVAEFQGLYTGFQAFRNLSKIYADRETCVEAWGEESKQRVVDFIPLLESRLSESPFVATSQLSIADITAYIFVGFTQNALQIDILNQNSHIKSWFDKLTEMSEFQ
jgi:glutathione S-transferase